MNYSEQKIPTANTSNSKIDVSSTHITTGSFMQLHPVYYRHMLPGEHIKGQMNLMSRLEPVAVPTYGRCRINTRAFFVPYKSVFRFMDEFLVDTIASGENNTSLVPEAPQFLNTDLLQLLMDGNNSTALNPSDPQDAAQIAAGLYDFHCGGSYYVFTYAGRCIYKTFVSLGYRPIYDSKDEDFTWSALPLMCFARVYIDYYLNSAYYNYNLYNQVKQILSYNDPGNPLILSLQDLQNIVSICFYVCYDSSNDVYVGAWDNPVSPNLGLNSTTYSIYDITNQDPMHYTSTTQLDFKNFRVGINSVGTPTAQMDSVDNLGVHIGSGSGMTSSTYIHTALKSLTDYIKRNQMAGGYAASRFLAHFGINLKSDHNKSVYVNGSSADIIFGDVMQTVNTNSTGDSNLGDYSGKGIGNGSLDFDFTADNFGMFLIVYSIQPQGRIVDGYDRNNRHITRTQFFQTEFDNLGCDAIEKGEIYVSKEENFGSAADYTGIFGFAPRYYEMKQKKDMLTGDFICSSVMAGGNSWHLFRQFDDASFGSNISNLVHSREFMLGEDAGQYNRIFQSTDPYWDSFKLVFHTSAMSLAPCKSLFDTYDFDEVGRIISVSSNGAKLN